MYLGKFSLEFVACKLSLNRNWQGYSTSFSTSLVRYKSTKQNRHLFRVLYNLPKGTNQSYLGRRDLHTTAIMGSSFSRGRKFSPEKKNGPVVFFIVLTMTAADKVVETSTKEQIEEAVCREDELQENDMKVFNLGGDELKVLLIKQKGKVYATGTKCTHYGAPLAKAYLGTGRIRCQWHGACFNLESGDIEDFPGLDCLPSYEVRVAEGKIYVRAEKQQLLSNKRVLPFIRSVDPQNGTFLVVGGGAAGATCVETLRAQGFDGKIFFIFAENHLPYDRVKLSKNLSANIQDITLRSMEFYQERNIEIMQGVSLVQLNSSKKEVHLDNGQVMKYDRIFLATGSSPRKLEVAGSDLNNIYVLRTVEDAEDIRASLTESSQVVILGTSFIGMEVAAFCAGRVRSVAVIGKTVPFKALLGQEIGARIIKIFEEKGVQFHLNKTIESFVGEGDDLKSVVLSDNVTIPADICIVGIGSTPNTNYLESSGIQRKPNGTVEVNDYLQTSSHDVFAGGDIALAPVLGQKACIAHWSLACYHGNVAAYNMLGWEKQLKTVPFFWTMLLGKGIRYAGYAKNADDTVIAGDLNDLAFIAFHCSGDNVLAVSTLNRDPLASKFAEMLYEGRKLKKSQINDFLSS